MSYSRLLVALDASPQAPAVLAAAADLARSTHAQLVLFRAVEPPVAVTPSLPPEGPDLQERALVETALDELGRLAKTVPPSEPPPPRLFIEVGTPWRMVLDAARRVDADLIVVGARGHATVDRELGTTAGAVVAHADRAVLVARTT